ncbi:MAG: hypothetical protein ACI9G1_003191, partial [Pirellulaceae bacterium]
MSRRATMLGLSLAQPIHYSANSLLSQFTAQPIHRSASSRSHDHAAGGRAVSFITFPLPPLSTFLWRPRIAIISVLLPFTFEPLDDAMIRSLSFVLVCGFSLSCFAETEVILSEAVHLRSGDQREWESFPERSLGSELVRKFASQENATAQTISIRHDDVKMAWKLMLNGKQIGRLPSDENAMVELFEVPVGYLKDGENELKLEATSSKVDDIWAGPIYLDSRTTEQVASECRIEVAVRDGGRHVPCRLTILDQSGALAVLGNTSDEHSAVRTGMLYSIDGSVELLVPAGKYTIFANRGMEYSMDTAVATAKPNGKTKVELDIHPELDTKGYVSCDTHVHTFTYSRHGDASIEERMLTIVGEHLELPIACDHNLHIDYEPVAKKMGVRKWFTPVIGNEVTTKLGHFNAFPMQAGSKPPNHTADNWPEIFEGIYSTTSAKVVILNHGQDLHGGYRPFDRSHFIQVAGVNTEGWELKANGMELINSAALQSDVMNLYRDWFGLLNRGYTITPIGSSDSHEVARKLVGQGRTYVRCDDSDPSNINVDEAIRSLVEGRVLVSMGLFTQLTVDKKFREGDLASVGKQYDAAVKVQRPSWLNANRIVLYANGVAIREEKIEMGDELVWEQTWRLDRAAHDVHLVAVATGPGVDEL